MLLLFPVMELATVVGAGRPGAVAEGKVLLFGVVTDELFVGAGVIEEGVLGLVVLTGGGG